MKQETANMKCEQRIDKELSDRLTQFLPDFDAWSILQCKHFLKSEGHNITGLNPTDLRYEVQDAIQQHASEGLLSIERKLSFKLCLSWGGPSDYFELDWSESQESWTGGRYLFQNWFDGASRPISPEIAERLAELFAICV